MSHIKIIIHGNKINDINNNYNHGIEANTNKKKSNKDNAKNPIMITEQVTLNCHSIKKIIIIKTKNTILRTQHKNSNDNATHHNKQQKCN